MWLRLLLAFQCFAAFLSFTARADAYAWMIRHDYASCAQCHADPSGGSLLTPYGRAQSEILLRTYYGKGAAEDRDPGTVGDFMFGAFEMPAPLLMQVDLRGLALHTRAGDATDTRPVLMQADFISQVTVGRLRANSSVGYMNKGASPAWVLGKSETHHVVSRHHWIGVDIGEDKQFLLRAGRMNLPYGLRSIEHTMWIRNTGFKTDINSAQQHGIALAWNVDKIRAEAMVIGGNFQSSPDAYRSRGYAGYFEWAPSPKVAVGVSSMVTHAERDLAVSEPAFRQSHGLFGRFVPHKKLVVSAELDLLAESEKRKKIQTGTAAMVQLDYEPLQGVHAMGTLELKNPKLAREGTSFGAWGGAAWFFLPHADVRVDAVWRSEAGPVSSSSSLALLGQLHFFL
jgi:hypothetical protein